jgi:hypothetical protein
MGGNPVNRACSYLLLFTIAIASGLTVPTMATALLVGPPPGQLVVEPPSRSKFAAKMARVKEGMPEQNVRKLLGKPDDVRTCRELNDETARTKEIWCYGTNGHLTFPTLGCVYFDTEGKVQYVFGGEGKPPNAKLFREGELRDLLRLIDKAPEANGNFYNPRTIIRIVNRLQPLGKEKALAAICEYVRVASTWHSEARDSGLFLVLRVLFDVPADPGYLPPVIFGYPSPWGQPTDPKIMPRFPILLVDDVPLLLVEGYHLGGAPEPVETHVEYFRKKGRLRAIPLVPTNQPLAILDHLPAAVEKFIADSKSEDVKDRILRDQLLRLVYSVYRKKGLRIIEDGVSYAGYYHDSPSWKEACAAVDKLGIRWDAGKARYTFRDGSTLPPPKRYARITWEIKAFDTLATLIIERQDDEVVNFQLTEPLVNGPPVPQPSLRIFRVKNKEGTLAKFPKVGLRGQGGGGRWGISGRKLPYGEAIQAELRLGSKSVLSPVYKP